jgi:hypothetical protein
LAPSSAKLSRLERITLIDPADSRWVLHIGAVRDFASVVDL